MMTRLSSTRSVDADFWEGRLKQARAYQKAAEDALTLANAGDNLTPAVSNMVLAAIAFGDAVTAKRRRLVNTQDHAAAPKLLRDTLGNTLPDKQEKCFRRLLQQKDPVQYGVRPVSVDFAQQVLSDLRVFALWVEDLV